MTHHLHEFMPPYTLHLNVENAPNPTRKQFDKTNIKGQYKGTGQIWDKCSWLSLIPRLELP